MTYVYSHRRWLYVTLLVIPGWSAQISSSHAFSSLIPGGANCSGCHGNPVVGSTPGNGGTLTFGSGGKTLVGQSSSATFEIRNDSTNARGGFKGNFPAASGEFSPNSELAIVGDRGLLRAQIGSSGLPASFIAESRVYHYSPTGRGIDTLVVTFTPSSAYFKSASDAAAQAKTITFKGQGVAPVVSLNSAQASAGNVLVGTSGTSTLTVQNLGDGNQSGLGDISNLKGSFAAGSGVFSGATAAFNLIDGASQSNAYSFNPVTRGTANLIVNVNATNGKSDGTNQAQTLSAQLSGMGVAPIVALDTTQVSAGNVLVGTSGLSKVTVHNTGDGNQSGLGDSSNLKGSFATVSGVFSGATAAFNLIDGASQLQAYSFNPVTRGTVNLSVNVNATNGKSDGTNQAQTLFAQLTGKGVAPVVNLNSALADAGNVLVGTSGTSRLTVQNLGDGNQSGLGDTSNLNGSFGSGAGVFSGTGSTFSLADSTSQLQQYSFMPVVRGVSTLDVSVSTTNGKSDGTNLAQSLSAQLSGKGVAPVVSLDSSQANAGNVLVGASGTSRLTVQNVGDGNLSGQGAASNLRGGFASGSGAFSGAGAAFSLADSTSQVQQYAFTPANRGLATLGLNVTTDNGSSNGQNQGQTLAAELSGKGVAPVISINTAQASAGNVRIGTSGVSSLGVQNVGDGNLSGQGADSNLKGSFASASGAFNGAGATFSLADGASQIQQYSFTPVNRGFAQASADVSTSNGSTDERNTAQALSAQISGTGVGPTFASSVAVGSTIDFGTGSGQRSLPLTIFNNTPDADLGALTALTLLSYSISGPGAGLFSLSNLGAPTQLAKGASMALDIGFLAGSHGVYSAMLSLLTDEGAALGMAGNAFSYSLTATAVPEPAAVQMFGAGLMCLGLLVLRKRRVARCSA